MSHSPLFLTRCLACISTLKPWYGLLRTCLTNTTGSWTRQRLKGSSLVICSFRIVLAGSLTRS